MINTTMTKIKYLNLQCINYEKSYILPLAKVQLLASSTELLLLVVAVAHTTLAWVPMAL